MPSDRRIADWERIYLTEGPGPEGLAVELRGTSVRSQRYEEGPSGKAAAVGGRRPNYRESAAACRGSILKKLASLAFGRRAKSVQKTLLNRGLRQSYSLDILLEVAQLARSTYYYHEKRLTKADKYDNAKEAIAGIYQKTEVAMATGVSQQSCGAVVFG